MALNGKQTIELAINRLKEVLEGPAVLEEEDRSWIDELQRLFGREFFQIRYPERPDESFEAECELSLERLKKRPARLESILSTLQALLSANSYESQQLQLGDIELTVHNPVVGSRLRAEYDAEQFEDLFNFCEGKGVFAVYPSPSNGLAQTCAISPAENWEMSERHWVSDTVRVGKLQKLKYPDTWPLALTSIAHFYNQRLEVQAFNRIIEDPLLYYYGGLLAGVAHIFMADSYQRDQAWINNKRLECHGLALDAFCEAMIAGLVEGREYGFKDSVHLADQQTFAWLINAIGYLAEYVEALDYPDAPSAGTWEEVPFPGGLTWDTACICQALMRLSDLLHNDSYDGNAGIEKVRAALRERDHKALFCSKERLDALIRKGQSKVRERLVNSPNPSEHPRRSADASLIFVSTTDLPLADSPVKDVSAHFAVLEFIEQNLVRRNGCVRFTPFEVRLPNESTKLVPDSYLTKNYWLSIDKDDRLNPIWREMMARFGSKDASEISSFVARSEFTTPDREAEWFMVSEIALAYCVQVEKLLAFEVEADRFQAEIDRLVEHGLRKATQFINRSYARITGLKADGAHWMKSNGWQCPGFRLPEAYEYVTCLRDDQDSVAVPGINTPLGWAAASLFDASTHYLEILKRTEASSG